MGMKYLLDSNAVIDYLSGKFPASSKHFMDGIVNDVPKLSVITKIEVLGYNAPPSDYRLLVDFMEASVILDLTEPVVNLTIELRKQGKIKLPDAIIAATALVHGLELISRNSVDFNSIKGLTVVDPHII